jgi:hypothetical protein
MSDLLLVVAEWVPWMQGRADQLDREAAFPDGPGQEGNLSVGRLLDAHVNARRT